MNYVAETATEGMDGSAAEGGAPDMIKSLGDTPGEEVMSAEGGR